MWMKFTGVNHCLKHRPHGQSLGVLGMHMTYRPVLITWLSWRSAEGEENGWKEEAAEITYSALEFFLKYYFVFMLLYLHFLLIKILLLADGKIMHVCS